MTTGGLLASAKEREGYVLERQLDAALPMQVWRVDLDIERERPVTAAESTVLALIDAGITDVGELAQAMGMGADTRLPERVLVKLLGAGAVDTLGAGFVVTATGKVWKAEGSARGRERVTFEARLDPTRDALEWVDHEPSAFATEDTWTIELPPVEDGELFRRRTDLGDLVREGLPDDEFKAPVERRPPVELRGLAVVSRRIHWREVRLDVWSHPLHRDVVLIGYMGDAEHPPLTGLLTRHEVKSERRRIRPRKAS